MKNVYTSKLFLVLLFLSLSTISILKAQNTNCTIGGLQCQSITQDFNSGSGGFTSTTFAHNPGIDGDMRVVTASSTAYTLTSPSYALSTNGVAFFGFQLSGGPVYAIGGSIRIAILNTAGAELAFCNIPNTIEAACVQLVDPDLTPQPVRYQITITTGPSPVANGGVLAFDDFSNGSSQAPLPVELGSFDARRNSNSVSLQWETASETNVRGFEIQRKSGDGSFLTIGVIASKSPGGTSNTPLRYSFTDLNNNNSGVNQYRIKMVDLDGRSKLSVIRSVNGLKENARILIYPNPAAAGPVNVVFPNTDPRDITVTDVNGRVHYSWKSYKEQDLTVKKLGAGNYLLRIIEVQNGKNEVYRLTVTK
ncbi:MAG TPA: T9SS type A sorting domain-containing protein [Flavitalea sp.]|nr:T9SS type A sorting domain-containing protein [Flavitalea sp.]